MRRLLLLVLIVVGVGMIGSSVSGVASIDHKLEQSAPKVIPVESSEDVRLEKKGRCLKHRRDREDLQRQPAAPRDEKTSYST